MRFVDAIFLGRKGAMRCDFDYDAMRLPSLIKTQKKYSIETKLEEMQCIKYDEV